MVKELESGVTVGDLRGFCIERNCFFLLPLLSARKKDCAAGGDIDISILISLSLSLYNDFCSSLLLLYSAALPGTTILLRGAGILDGFGIFKLFTSLQYRERVEESSDDSVE